MTKLCLSFLGRLGFNNSSNQNEDRLITSMSKKWLKYDINKFENGLLYSYKPPNIQKEEAVPRDLL